jgi:general nucleoside transport system ATP-binding protein
VFRGQFQKIKGMEVSMKRLLVSMRGIHKSFGTVKACSDINLDIYEGEIHTLLGENGAGKSTLINILSGIYTPDGGSIEVDGEKVSLSSPREAREKGIGTIYQHFKLVDAMTARENILLGQRSGYFFGKREADLKIRNLCEDFGINLELDKYVSDMSVGEKQNLEILKVLYRGARLLILDEPTTVFTPGETEGLFSIMKRMKAQGCGIIFISHKMDEVMKISDKITVLRRGETVATMLREEAEPRTLTDLMVGHPMDLSIKRVVREPGKVILSVNNLSIEGNNSRKALKNLTFNIREGEIFGIAGIGGSGQRELCEAIAGIRSIRQGEIILDGEHLEGKNSGEFIKRGITLGFIPEDRLGMGLVASMDMVDNLLLKGYQSDGGMFINRKPFIKKAEELIKTLDIKTPGVNYSIRYLSGGNIQKILLGRELGLKPRLLIMAYPVRGLDISTCYRIYNLINEEKKKGTSIVFVGEDLDVLIEISDRIMVLSKGELGGILEGKDATREEIGAMMVGLRGERSAI